MSSKIVTSFFSTHVSLQIKSLSYVLVLLKTLRQNKVGTLCSFYILQHDIQNTASILCGKSTHTHRSCLIFINTLLVQHSRGTDVQHFILLNNTTKVIINHIITLIIVQCQCLKCSTDLHKTNPFKEPLTKSYCHIENHRKTATQKTCNAENDRR